MFDLAKKNFLQNRKTFKNFLVAKAETGTGVERKGEAYKLQTDSNMLIL